MKETLDKNTLTQMNPTLSLDWHPSKNAPLTPDDVSPDDERRVWWKCHICGEQWEAAIYDRCHGMHCPYCLKRTKIEQRQHKKRIEQRAKF